VIRFDAERLLRYCQKLQSSQREPSFAVLALSFLTLTLLRGQLLALHSATRSKVRQASLYSFFSVHSIVMKCPETPAIVSARLTAIPLHKRVPPIHTRFLQPKLRDVKLRVVALIVTFLQRRYRSASKVVIACYYLQIPGFHQSRDYR